VKLRFAESMASSLSLAERNDLRLLREWMLDLLAVGHAQVMWAQRKLR
jgi:hypothetical protein